METYNIVHPRLDKITRLIISSVAIAGTLSVLVLAPGIAPGLQLILKLKQKISNHRLEREIGKVVQQGYLKRHPHRSGDTYELTPKGRFIYMTNKAFISERKKTIQKPEDWDAIWRIVIFDVSEEDRNARNILRKLLSQAGFVYFQQSVWIYPYPCDDLIQAIKEQLHLRSKVVYIQAQYVEGDASIRKHFKIK